MTCIVKVIEHATGSGHSTITVSHDHLEGVLHHEIQHAEKETGINKRPVTITLEFKPDE